MDNEKAFFNEDTYKYLVDKFGKDKIAQRYDWLYTLLSDYIEKNNCRDRAVISEDILKHVIVDYFVDIDRLKEFQNIKLVHSSKIYAYSAFWLLRHKVIQVTVAGGAGDLDFINERFVCHFIRSYFFTDGIGILDCNRESINNFIETMLYHFEYREYSAKNIELMILAFQAGRDYQYSADHQ